MEKDIDKAKTTLNVLPAEERDNLWLQKAATGIESERMHENHVCLPL